MTAGRLRLAASTGLAAGLVLLAVSSFSGCSMKREYVRRGAVLDSLAARAVRIEQAQAQQGEELRRLRADVLTELEVTSGRLDQLEAQLNDLVDRLDRISRRFGIIRGDLTLTRPDSVPLPDTAGQVPDTLGAGAEQLYNTAYLDFTRGKYEVAVGGFRQYLAKFPESENADNAQYWVGECYYSLGQLDAAEKEFKQVLTVYAKGNKAPAAAYKLGLVYLAQGKKTLARQQFKAVMRDYPGTSEARLGKDRLQTLE